MVSHLDFQNSATIKQHALSTRNCMEKAWSNSNIQKPQGQQIAMVKSSWDKEAHLALKDITKRLFMQKNKELQSNGI